MAGLAALVVVMAACGGDDDGSNNPGGADAGPPPAASEDWQRDILTTHIELDLGLGTARAIITLAGSESTGASFETGDLIIEGVTGPGGAELMTADSAGQLDIGVPASAEPVEITIDYRFRNHGDFDGWMSGSGVTFLWPYFCGNLFPCKSDPSDGMTFSMSVTGQAAGLDAVYPTEVSADAPSYMPAVAVADFTEIDLGTTTDGTQVVAWHLPGQDDDTAAGTENLLAVFEFFEQTYGSYTFGDKVGSVSANWGGGNYGGMEHHPYWHVSSGSMSSEEVHAHEAAHGWFGNGVRIECWEDFVLSEGTVSYMAARALSQSGVDLWPSYGCELAAYCDSATMNTIALPSTCGDIDILNDPLWSGVPYMKGAYFFKEVADVIGADALDVVLADFYQAHVGKAARMDELIDAITAAHPGDAAAVDDLADTWLRQLSCPIASDVLCP